MSDEYEVDPESIPGNSGGRIPETDWVAETTKLSERMETRKKTTELIGRLYGNG